MQRPFNIPIELPRGPEHYWRIMRELSQCGGFTIPDVAGCTNGVAFNTVKAYAKALLRMGAIEKVGARSARSKNTANLYRVAIKNRVAPVVRRESYAGRRGVIQDRLWNTMRRMRDFSIAELCFTASAGDMEIKPHTADQYIRRLAKVGVIMVVEPYRKGAPGAAGARAGRYRLRPSANTGPKPPKIFKAEIVFDSNRNAVIGETSASEASL